MLCFSPQALVLFLLLASASAAVAASLTLSPYTVFAPQKIVMNQVCAVPRVQCVPGCSMLCSWVKCRPC